MKNVNQNTTSATNVAAAGATTATAAAAANNDAAKKHFIAPSLSQYRFVSGQQVNRMSIALSTFVFVPFFARCTQNQIK